MKFLLVLLAVLNMGVGVGSDEVVVCVHGFMRNESSMSTVVRAFEKEGCTVVNWSYSSRKKTIEGHAADLVVSLNELSCQGKPINFVTHSMGGLIVRSALNHPDCPQGAKKGKAVLLAPPNRGSAFGRRLNRNSVVREIVGEYSGKQLLTTPLDGFDYLGAFPEQVDVLVIAGKYDRKVSVKETYLPTSHHHEVVRAPHWWIAHCSTAIKKAKLFVLARSK